MLERITEETGDGWIRESLNALTVPILILLALFGALWAWSHYETATEKCDRIYFAQLVERQPPPRPSEVAWYNEHCWEGKPR